MFKSQKHAFHNPASQECHMPVGKADQQIDTSPSLDEGREDVHPLPQSPTAEPDKGARPWSRQIRREAHDHVPFYSELHNTSVSTLPSLSVTTHVSGGP